MNVELSNGLDHFFQWDKRQKVKIPDGVPTVHFKWGNDAVSFDVVDGWVEIAPELTQKPGNIYLWTYKEDHTMDAARIPVESRPKPADYIYTPTEIKTWESLDERIEALEQGGGIAGVASVNGETGHVIITASGIGAATQSEVTSAVNSAWAEAQKTLQPMFDAKQPVGDYVTQSGLQDATNAALAQAKASGEFDGPPGAPGAPGTDGYSPTVTVEQTDTGATITATDKTGTTTVAVKNGSPGAPGTSGTTPHIGDNGNWYLGETDTGKPSQGPAGAGLDVVGATVGQTVKIAAVDSDGVPTAWVPVDMVSGNGEWRQVIDSGEITEATGTFEATGLGGATEILIEWLGLQSTGTTQRSGLYTRINGVSMTTAPTAAPVVAENGRKVYGWTYFRYDGKYWVGIKGADSISDNAIGIEGNPTMSYRWDSRDIGPAESINLSNVSTYSPTSGKLKVWVR